MWKAQNFHEAMEKNAHLKKMRVLVANFNKMADVSAILKTSRESKNGRYYAPFCWSVD